MSDKINNVIEWAYKSFVPKETDVLKIKSAAEWVKNFILLRSKALGTKITAEFGGSYAKNTWVRDNSDVDIFVSFDSEKKTKLLENLVPSSFKQERGTRTYFRGESGGITVEIIPVVRFNDITKVENSIDLSILHAAYINSRMKEKLRKDTVILKEFCKANGRYGSETYIHGFSGYSLELLIIKYGGLKELFQAVSSWMPGVYVDIENAYPDQSKALEAIGARESPLILVDPTNPKRNVCGSLNAENFAGLVFAVKRFMTGPSKEFFVRKDSVKQIIGTSKSRGTKLFRYKTEIKGPRDRFLSKYNKGLFRLVKALKENGVGVYDYKPLYSERKVELFLEIESTPVTKTRKVYGPNVWLNLENFQKFLKQHPNTYLSGELAAYDKPYKITNFNSFIAAKLKGYIGQNSILKN